ncbi:MAG: hypothetical protein JWP75_1559, partial [Frondihabitans sp.]|nr:hypothetical protein [Frondihabitans sp.]
MMHKHFNKVVAAAVLVGIGIFAAPMAANAAGYVPASNITVSGAVVPGGTSTVGFASGSFTDSETVSFSVTGDGAATLGAATTTVTGTKVANADGSVSEKVTLPADASGTYSLTATGLTSGNVGTAALTVVPADAGASSATNSSGGLAFTGSTVSMLVIWGAGGAIVLG